jgi:hypothetical protein
MCFVWWFFIEWDSIKAGKGCPEGYGRPNGAGNGPGEPVAVSSKRPKEGVKGEAAMKLNIEVEAWLLLLRRTTTYCLR